uniref:Uncharacterized protein n=1 Tax=Candidatus Methanophagaceae archaeon ANME-1 ERB6 TaxID=2759912 RepID=A0A7G9YZL8_9EURY|nr:hypothetical protein HCHKDHBN_00023 [Methanosarcinales archaeon ANME-1 ERB6]
MKMKKHMFSVSLEKEDGLKNLCIGSEFGPKVEIEGELGKLERINFVENAILEIRGSGGILRIDLNKEAFEGLLKEGEKND